MLQQPEGGPWRHIGFFSWKLFKTEHKYSAFNKYSRYCFASIMHFRYMVEDSFHGIAHPGTRASKRPTVFFPWFVWKHAGSDVTALPRACLTCQCSKVTRHVHVQPQHIPAPRRCFNHIHAHCAAHSLPHTLHTGCHSHTAHITACLTQPPKQNPRSGNVLVPPASWT